MTTSVKEAAGMAAASAAEARKARKKATNDRIVARLEGLDEKIDVLVERVMRPNGRSFHCPPGWAPVLMKVCQLDQILAYRPYPFESDYERKHLKWSPNRHAHFGHRARAIRQHRGLSVPEVAQAIGFTEDRVEKIEGGGMPAGGLLFHDADRWAKTLNVSAPWLITGYVDVSDDDGARPSLISK